MLMALDRQRQPGHSRIVEALRLSELPDRLLSRRCGDFAYLSRLLVWIAYQRISQHAALLIDDLCDELRADESEDTAGILRQLADSGTTVVFTSRDTAAASLCADRLFAFASHSLQMIRRPHRLSDGR
jgi:ABC-type cobalamin/Fe3+-siderophores transport system ATPase subunit